MCFSLLVPLQYLDLKTSYFCTYSTKVTMLYTVVGTFFKFLLMFIIVQHVCDNVVLGGGDVIQVPVNVYYCTARM